MSSLLFRVVDTIALRCIQVLPSSSKDYVRRNIEGTPYLFDRYHTIRESWHLGERLPDVFPALASRRHDNIRYSAVDLGSGHEVVLSETMRPSLDLALSVVHTVKMTKAHQKLGACIRTVLADISHVLDGDDFPGIADWPSWLGSADIHLVFAPPMDTGKLGWVTKVAQTKDEYILCTGWELARVVATPPDNIYSQFLLATAVLYESMHIITKYVFHNWTTPQLSGCRYLTLGDSGYELEHQFFGGRIMTEWDCEAHVGDYALLKGIAVHDPKLNEVFVLERDYIEKFLHAIGSNILPPPPPTLQPAPDDGTVRRMSLETSPAATPLTHDLYGKEVRSPSYSRRYKTQALWFDDWHLTSTSAAL